jgi:hypothetical protein
MIEQIKNKIKDPNRPPARSQLAKEGTVPMTLIIIIILLLLVFGGGGGYYAHRSYGGRGLGGVLGLILVIILVLWLLGALGGTHV